MTLAEYVDEQTKLLADFKRHWQEAHIKAPDTFPNNMNEGDWDEQFHLYGGNPFKIEDTDG